MKLLVIGAGMMGSAAAYDMARQPQVSEVTLADSDARRVAEAVERINNLTDNKKVEGASVDAADLEKVAQLMKGHDGVLSAVPYFFNLGLAKTAIESKCHFADLGGNNVVVRQTLELAQEAKKNGVGLAPDCGLSPGMASILGGELLRRVGGRADSLKVYVGGLPQNPKAPFNYQLVFSVEGLINEYCEPARILRDGELTMIDPLSEIEEFNIEGWPALEAFHTSGGTSTMPETFGKNVGECFEKTIRYKGHCAMIRSLYDFGFFSSEKRKIGQHEITPRQMTTSLFLEKFVDDASEATILRVEAHQNGEVASFTLIDKTDPETKLTSMMRTTAWPASIVLQMMASGEITKRGDVLQERDVPAEKFLDEMAQRGLPIAYEVAVAQPEECEVGA
ncbi:Saccharopine dehydrogenase [Candidatus Koribacter versatilis Ellin345]|uniref:Saccharopine dehydrogenase n=1 Tax=Koribacter versatilis (strain Ellin345) TaxID=204669 RepID=Q1IQQ8_KORVE|nr:saccharopine dehydrogenase C-terminal domain-containing protein [Candidatus Koribacter versatilis]ABF40792.1 Saccharopine dehydrogenase [Candidatus Koribacter versatilis Ellin345]